MNCHDADILIQESLDAPLTTTQRATLDIHLSGCPACRTAWEEYRQLALTARMWLQSEATESGGTLSERVLAAIAESGHVPLPSTEVRNREPVNLAPSVKESLATGGAATRRTGFYSKFHRPAMVIVGLAALAAAGSALSFLTPGTTIHGLLDTQTVAFAPSIHAFAVMPTLSALVSDDVRAMSELVRSVFSPPAIPLSLLTSVAVVIAAAVANVILANYTRNRTRRGAA